MNTYRILCGDVREKLAEIESGSVQVFRNMRDQESREFWESVERAKREWEVSKPSWAREPQK